MKLWVAAAGDACDPMTWSGTPYHFAEWGRYAGFDVEGLTLHKPSELERRIWNLVWLARTRQVGGFQYSPYFLHRMWRHGARAVRQAAVVNCFQLYPESVLKDRTIRKWFHIDGTLRDLFVGTWSPKLPSRVMDAALALEQRGYEAADGILCHSDWTARSVRDQYGINPAKVFTVVPGANLAPALYEQFSPAPPLQTPETGPLRLVFTGRYWDRKGLDRLLRAMLLAQAQGAQLALRVIGCAREMVPKELQGVPGVDWVGSVEKNLEPKRFLETVAWGEVGCLLSREEFGGMVLREFAALGMPILAPDVQGSPDHAGPASILVKPADPDAFIADKLCLLAERGPEFQRLRSLALASRQHALWSDTVRKIVDIIASHTPQV